MIGSYSELLLVRNLRILSLNFKGKSVQEY